MPQIHLISFILLISYASSASIRGVNLGGWLVLEPWITPSLFEPFLTFPFEERAIDEFTFNLRLGPEEAQIRLENHWKTFIVENDFKTIAELGLTHVRIPYGWWILGDTSEYVHNITYLDLALEWAQKYGLKVLLDLHGAPGSQNGLDNSGKACNETYFNFLGQGVGTETQQKPDWVGNLSNLEKTQNVLWRIAQRYKGNPAVWGLGLVNEPIFGEGADVIKQWYDETYNLLKGVVPDWKIVMDFSMINFPDFEPKPWPKDFMPNLKSYGDQVIMDQHIYLWPTSLDQKPEDILEYSCGTLISSTFFKQQKEIPSIIGEWSLAIDDCARWLLGFNNEAIKERLIRDGCKRELQDIFWQEFAKNQLWMFEQAEGWFFWTFKNEGADEWSWLKLVEKGWVPRDAREIGDFTKDSRCNRMKTEL